MGSCTGVTDFCICVPDIGQGNSSKKPLTRSVKQLAESIKWRKNCVRKDQ
jgi:hypothetical protein